MMKKLSYQKLLFSIICCMLILSSSTMSVISEESNTSIEWVVMIYLNGDNKLSAAQQQILQQIRNIGSTDAVIFTILIDSDQLDDTKLYYVVDKTLTTQTWPSESDMSNADTLKSFVHKVKTDIVSNKYGLIISSNKGSGWQGVSWDDHGDGLMITMPELSQSLCDVTDNGKDPLDLIAIETCLGGNLEIIYQLRSFCEVYVGYADCGIIGDWPFDDSLTLMKNEPDMSGIDFAKAIVNTFEPRHVPAYKLHTVMGATDTACVEQIGTNLDLLAKFFINDMDIYRNAIETALHTTRIYGEMWGITYYRDISHFLDLLEIDSNEFRSIKNSILTSISTSVIDKAHLPEDISCGFNIYLPQTKGDYNNALRYESGSLPSAYEETFFAEDTSWDEFLKTYLDIYENTPPSLPLIDGPLKGKSGSSYEYQVVSTDIDNDNIRYCIDWGDSSKETWTKPTPSGTIVTISHIWNKTGTYTVKAKAKDDGQAETEWATLEVSMPRPHITILSKPYIALLGKIRDIEEDQFNGFRFLPVNILYIGLNEENRYFFNTLDEQSGGFPCCGYIDRDDFRGIITSSLICGIWFMDIT